MTPCKMNDKPLNELMDNVLAWRLGEVALEAGDPKRKDVGDLIDRGLILRRLLEEKGFYLVLKTPENSNPNLM